MNAQSGWECNMTYWATLWYAGSVVLSLGYEGQTLEQCNYIGEQMMYDITTAYEDPNMLSEIVNLGVFPTDEFSFSCENQMLPVDEKYRK